MFVWKIGLVVSSRRNARKILSGVKFYHAKQKHYEQTVPRDDIDPKVLRLRDKLLYCDYLDLEAAKLGYVRRKKEHVRTVRFKNASNRLAYQEPVSSVIVDKLGEESNSAAEDNEELETENETLVKFDMQYLKTNDYGTVDRSPEKSPSDETSSSLNPKYVELYEKYLEAKKSDGNDTPNLLDIVEKERDKESLPKGELWKIPPTWMSDFEQFDDTSMDAETFRTYGTSNPSSKPSSVACGGCGALLHCKDPLIPGYLPLELFSNGNEQDLKQTVCQRCHFLKAYNAALRVRVSISDYPKLLKVIKTKKCAILLLVDLTDFPCSIWPDLKSVLHPFTPIVLVGNKVDLLPKDCPKFFDNVKKQLVDAFVDVTGVKRENVMHATLVSAKTGYGIEELITKLQRLWGHRGDVYMVGCTNVGKSTMFNAMIDSDYCKIQAVDLVQRATISPWPGTTLNLLKFPLLNPVPKKLWSRAERLKQEQYYKHRAREYNDQKFKETGDIRYATLTDHVGKTFFAVETEGDPFSEKSATYMARSPCFDESRPEYEMSRWCYDTPGTVHRDQILDLLTMDELSLTVPDKTIQPRTFLLRPKETVFVAGMGRLDFLAGNVYIRCTLFASMGLPLTMCYTEHADDLYERLLTTKAFAVPVNDPDRLKFWPKLDSKDFEVTGIHYKESTADVLLSSIGWIAVTPHENEHVALRAWTPQGRGIYLRTPALLSRSVNFRGRKMEQTPLYSLGRQVYVK